ncbi:MAG: hypothetical protein E3I12_01120 [Hadesarchaea archaeon]|nr:MAG: hypothetical protein E3I12_01120 [Hadesarchaea archaeon]
MRKIKEIFQRLRRWISKVKEIKKILQYIRRQMGIAGISLSIMSTFVIGSVIVYYATGMGEVPPVELSVAAHDNAITLTVLDGEIPAEDWEYLVFDERVNPPIMWDPAPADMEPGEVIVLKSDARPATYRVQIRHKPTLKFIFETKITVEG